MAPRAQWKGYLKIEEITCSVALYTAASQAERTSFHTINKATGNRVKREFVDEKTGKPVDREDQVKGYETSEGHYVVLEPEEIEAVIPDGDKTLSITSFIPCSQVDTVYLDRPYYLAPADDAAIDAFVLIRESLRKKKVAAVAEAVLFRRVRKVLIRPDGDGLVASTLNFDYEVRAAEKAFSRVPDVKIQKPMLDLATHIIDTMQGTYDPASFEDRYEQALSDLVKAKLEGRKIAKPKPRKEGKVVDLMDALRRSADAAAKPAKRAPAKKSTRSKAA